MIEKNLCYLKELAEFSGNYGDQKFIIVKLLFLSFNINIIKALLNSFKCIQIFLKSFYNGNFKKSKKKYHESLIVLFLVCSLEDVLKL